MLTLLFGALATASVVQSQSFGDDFNNYGTVAFIRSGERTPYIRPGNELLTALGAQQMYELGQNFRGRYISDESAQMRMGVRHIEGMAPDRLDSDQLLIQTLDKPHLVASAQAFMQGLYPPHDFLNGTTNGSWPDAVGLLANRTAIDYPLGGYQYANVRTLSRQDYQSIYINGHYDCLNAELESASYEISEPFLSTQAAERAFYQNMSYGWFDHDLPGGEQYLDFMNANGIYDTLSYQYTHDLVTYRDLTNENNAGVFEKVRYLADQDAWSRYGNVSADTDPAGYRAMAGKTLAALILGRFQRIVSNQGNATNGVSQPLTLLFGDYEPLLSFLAVAEVDYQQKSMSHFHAIPEFASAIIFELFTRGNATAEDPNDLWVRFSYHNGTSDYEDNAPQAYSIFRNGPSRMDMTWHDFSASMERVMVNQVEDWCQLCNAQSFFCYAIDDTNANVSLQGPAKAKGKVSPVVAGVIGAVVTLAVAGLLFGIAMLLGGVRLHRVERRRQSSLGGFKGSAKLASDPDLSLAKNGVAPAGTITTENTNANTGADKRTGHERVGSWELRQKEGSGDMGSPRGSFEAIEAAMGRPVEPSERV